MLPNKTQQVIAVNFSTTPVPLLSTWFPTNRWIALLDWLNANLKCWLDRSISFFVDLDSKNRLYIAPRAMIQC